jgi:hypothetical protein
MTLRQYRDNRKNQKPVKTYVLTEKPDEGTTLIEN